jgi:hypothetical protein
MKLFHLATAGLVLAWLPMCASTVVSDLFGTGGTGESPDLWAVSWTQTSTYTDVTIDAFIGGNGLVAPAEATAYLMSQIGPGTTSADEVTTPPFSIDLPYGPDSFVQLFSNLTLGPGTYYLVIDPTSNFGWGGDTIPAQILGTGVTQNLDGLDSGTIASFAPASSFTAQNSDTRLFSVTGTLSSTGAPSPVPEPSTTVLLAIGLGGLGMLARRRRAHLI